MQLSSPKHSANEILRSEIGSSSMDTRDKITKIAYFKHLMEGNNEMLNKIVEHDIEKSITPFSQKIHKYMTELNININYIKTNKLDKIKDNIKNIDTEIWRNCVENKRTLEMYLEFKHEIKEEKKIYDNTEASIILFKARSNTLKLNCRKKHNKENEKEDTLCPLNKEQTNKEETLKHFMIECISLKTIRNKMKNVRNEYDMKKKTPVLRRRPRKN